MLNIIKKCEDLVLVGLWSVDKKPPNILNWSMWVTQCITLFVFVSIQTEITYDKEWSLEDLHALHSELPRLQVWLVNLHKLSCWQMLGKDKLHEFNLNAPVNQVPSGFPAGVGNG